MGRSNKECRSCKIQKSLHGYQPFHNYIRQHEGLHGETPDLCLLLYPQIPTSVVIWEDDAHPPNLCLNYQ